MIYAKIIEDSIPQFGKRLTTLELNYPRCIHGELLTHRVFSRNSMSSRAIPVAKMIEQVRTNPFIPLHWGMNQPGMQAAAEADADTKDRAIDMWLHAADLAADSAEDLSALGLHKQLVNRLLEPFQWMRTIVTATEFENFFALRDHPDAEPHFQMLSRAMRKAMEESTPVLRDGVDLFKTSNWHLPYIREEERQAEGFLQLCKVSAARCARVSYLTHDNEHPTLQADLALYDRLASGVPIHASPLEHQGAPAPRADIQSGNFVGWIQYRQLAEGVIKAEHAI